MDTITLSDGTVVEGFILDSQDGTTIYMYLDKMSVVEGVLLVSGKLDHLVAMNHGAEHIYDGYTEIYAVSHEYGNCNFVLKKPRGE